MQVLPLDIPEVKLITPLIYRDQRGFFSETYHKERLRAAGIDAVFVQDNQSLSTNTGVIRGLHFQTAPHAQAKLVRVPRGAIFDVAVDIRAGSPTFGRYVSTILSAANWLQIWIPEGFAHGFMTIETNTEVIYKVTDYYAPACERCIAFDDPDLAISWPVLPEQAILSEKDRSGKLFRDLPTEFTYSKP